MPKTKESQDAAVKLESFLAKFTPEIAERTQAILTRMRKRLPNALELVYDNYNALAIGFGPTEKSSEAIFSIAVFPRWVSLFFLQAKVLDDPEKVLKGSGSVAKHVVLEDASSLDDPAIQALMKQALQKAVVPIEKTLAHRLIIKSVSAKQRPRRPSGTNKKTKG
jgi:hypothetical protein